MCSCVRYVHASVRARASALACAGAWRKQNHAYVDRSRRPMINVFGWPCGGHSACYSASVRMEPRRRWGFYSPELGAAAAEAPKLQHAHHIAHWCLCCCCITSCVPGGPCRPVAPGRQIAPCVFAGPQSFVYGLHVWPPSPPTPSRAAASAATNAAATRRAPHRRPLTAVTRCVGDRARGVCVCASFGSSPLAAPGRSHLDALPLGHMRSWALEPRGSSSST